MSFNPRSSMAGSSQERLVTHIAPHGEAFDDIASRRAARADDSAHLAEIIRNMDAREVLNGIGFVFVVLTGLAALAVFS